MSILQHRENFVWTEHLTHDLIKISSNKNVRNLNRLHTILFRVKTGIRSSFRALLVRHHDVYDIMTITSQSSQLVWVGVRWNHNSCQTDQVMSHKTSSSLFCLCRTLIQWFHYSCAGTGNNKLESKTYFIYIYEEKRYPNWFVLHCSLFPVL